MIGQIVFQTMYKGEIYSIGRNVYALCNGQVIPRSSTSLTDGVWPSGAYGSTESFVSMPNLSNYGYLRGADLGRNADPDRNSRTTLSGIGPTGTEVGAFQAGSLRSHNHQFGQTSISGPVVQSGGGQIDFYTRVSRQQKPTNNIISSSAFTTVNASSTDVNNVDARHHTFFPYLQIV